MNAAARRAFAFKGHLSALKQAISPAIRKLSLNTMPGKTTQIGEWKIHYEQIGSGSQAVFLMPGALGSTRTDFNSQLEKLDSRKSMTIIAWDPPGYGYSRPPDRTYPLDFFQRDADVAAKLLQVLHLKDVAVVGWSDGGICALILAADHPELVKKLVVFGTNSYVTKEDLKLYEAVRDVEAWSPRMRAPMEQVYGADYFKVTWSKWVDAMRTIYEKNDGDLCKQKLSKIECPTLVIHGKKDPMVPQFHPDFLISNIKNVRYFEFKDGKHNLHQKYADEFNEKVETFILENEKMQ